VKVDEILDRLEQLVEHARRVPFSSQLLLDENEVSEVIDQLRLCLPDEIKQANWTVMEQQRLLGEAHNEAARIMSRANERAEATVREHELLRRAEREGQLLVREAQEKAERTVREAESYAIDQLLRLEAHLSRTMMTVKRGVEALRADQPGGPPNGEPTPSPTAPLN
jgi:hypothetical protein